MHREIELDVADGSWHHLCVTWERKNRLLSVYKNGQRKYLSNEYSAGAQNRGIEGTLLLLGILFIRYTVEPLQTPSSPQWSLFGVPEDTFTLVLLF